MEKEERKVEEIKELTIVGAGVAGSYLYAQLTDKFPGVKLKIYDGAKKRGCTCAFGCFYTQLKEKLKKVHLEVEDYVLCKNRGLILNDVYFPLRNQVSINKPKLVNDLCPQKEIIKKWVRLNPYLAIPHRTIPYQTPPHLASPDLTSPCHATQRDIMKKENLRLIVNASGVPIIPHHIISTKQYRVKVEGLEPRVNYICVIPQFVGYSWAFSLDEEGRWFHLGAGCVNADPEILIRALVKRYGVKVKKKVCQCRRPIRIVNPKENLPVVGSEDLENLIVSVGEAGGYCVTGLTYIATESGWKYAFRIKEGERIISYNLEKGCFEVDKIIKINERVANEVFRITLSDGKIVEVTGEHIIPIVKDDTIDFLRASEIAEGMNLLVYPKTPRRYQIPANIKVQRTVKATTTSKEWRRRQSKRVKQAMEKVMSDPEKREKIMRGLKKGWELKFAPFRGKTWEEVLGEEKAKERKEKARRQIRELMRKGLMYRGNKGKPKEMLERTLRALWNGYKRFKESDEYREKVIVPLQRGREEFWKKLRNNPEELKKHCQKISKSVKEWIKENPVKAYISSVKGAIKTRKLCAKRKPKGQLKLEEQVRKIYGSLVVPEYPIWHNGKLVTIVDVAVPKLKLAFFADGEYWHNYPHGTEKDKEINEKLKMLGWKVFRYWEKDILEGRYSIPVVAVDPTVVKVEKIRRTYKVYDFSVERNHTFIANGIVLHNCFPVTGEGILPSMDSIDILVEGMNSPFWPAGYAFMTRKYLKKWSYDKAFKTWRLMLKHPKTAWLYGFRFMLSRARKRAQPEITLPRLIKAMIRMALGGRI